MAQPEKPKGGSSGGGHGAPAGHPSGHGGHGEHGEHGIARYFLVYGALLVFTALTVFTGVKDLGNANIFVAMAIATTKASLVVLFFMHLAEETAVNRMIFVSSILFALVMLLGIFGDLLTRSPGALPNLGPLPIKLHGHITEPAFGEHGDHHE